ncbi:DUF3450 family protein [Mucisphaera sp.]|uniref:DUF3450 family protein n=1 Tax=Mucisphaera sp. TaxID=2913024 RepID=UPI003D0CB0DF
MKPNTLTLILAALWLAAPAAAQPQDNTSEPAIDVTRDRLERWVETRRVISQEKRDLEVSREILSDRIDVLQAEIDDLRQRIAEAQDNLSKTDDQFNELTEQNDMLKQAADTLQASVIAMETQVVDLLDRAPAPIVDRLKVLSQQIPQDPQQTDLPLANRYQNVIGILNEINKFNGEITVTSEKRDLPNGQAAEVTVMYLGISKAYYTSNNAAIAGTGTPAPEGQSGWVWTPDNNTGPEILRAINIYRNTEVADFVDLPLDIQ